MIEAIFSYEFLQNAFLSGIIIGVIAPLLGLFIVVRRLRLLQMHLAMSRLLASLAAFI